MSTGDDAGDGEREGAGERERDESAERAVLASLAESHGDLTAVVADLQATVSRQQDVLQTVVTVLAERDDVPEDALLAAYRTGAEEGAEATAEKVAEQVKALRSLSRSRRPHEADHHDGDGQSADTDTDRPPRGFD